MIGVRQKPKKLFFNVIDRDFQLKFLYDTYFNLTNQIAKKILKFHLHAMMIFFYLHPLDSISSFYSLSEFVNLL
jgi:hypothetical protein